MSFFPSPFSREQLFSLYGMKRLQTVEVANVRLLCETWPSHLGPVAPQCPINSTQYDALEIIQESAAHARMVVLQQEEEYILLDGYDIYFAMRSWKDIFPRGRIAVWIISFGSQMCLFCRYQLAIFTMLRRVGIMECQGLRHFGNYIKVLAIMGRANRKESSGNDSARINFAIAAFDEDFSTHTRSMLTQLVFRLIDNMCYLEFIHRFHDDVLSISEEKGSFFILQNFRLMSIPYIIGPWWNDESIYCQELYTIFVLLQSKVFIDHERCEKLRNQILQIFQKAALLMEYMCKHLRPLSLQSILLAEFHASDMWLRLDHPRSKFNNAEKLSETILYQVGRALSSEIVEKVCNLLGEDEENLLDLHVPFQANWTKEQFNDLCEKCLDHVTNVMVVARVLHIPTVLSRIVL